MKLRDLRKQLGMSQQELASELGIHQGHLSRVETGTAKPSKMFVKLVKCLTGITIDEG